MIHERCGHCKLGALPGPEGNRRLPERTDKRECAASKSGDVPARVLRQLVADYCLAFLFFSNAVVLPRWIFYISKHSCGATVPADGRTDKPEEAPVIPVHILRYNICGGKQNMAVMRERK